MTENINISIARQYTAELKSALKRLIHQLNDSIAIPSDDHIIQLLSDNNSVLFIATEQSSSKVIGILTVVCYRIPTGNRSWIEDVVVDESMRGKGIGKLLVKQAIEYCKSAGFNNINLTSSPNRKEANELYKKMGFEKRETNVYRLCPE